MSFTRHFLTSRSGERGTALVGVLLLLLMMSALASALAVSGHTETLVTRNHQSAAQARAAAEAGLNHASELVIAWILEWKQNGFTDAANALDNLLAGVAGNPDWLRDTYELEITFGDAADPVDIGTGASYRVFLMDEDDDDGRGEDSTDLASLTAAYQEDGDPLTDNNRAVVIQAVGYGSNGATARLEAIISPYRLPAIVTNGDLVVDGTAGAVYISGDAIGGIHANGDLRFSGTKAIIGTPTALGTATSTGTCEDCTLPAITTNPGDSGGGRSPLDIPDIRASDFLSWADYILHDNGNIEDTSTGMTVASCAKSCVGSGWNYQSKSMEWTLTTTTGTYSTGTFYAEGPVTISAGTSVAPAVATIIAEGTITGSGNNYIRPAAGDLLFVTDVDLELSGTFQAGFIDVITNPLSPIVYEGQMLVREQIALSGTAVLFGQIVVQNATSTETPDTSSLSGNVVLSNSRDVGSSMFRVAGWREVR